MHCVIWYHLYNLKNVKNTHGVVLILVKLLAEACNFAKINTPPWVFFASFKLYKWYQFAQRITYLLLSKILLDFNPHTMVKHNLKILQHLLQGFQRVFDDFVGARRYTIQGSLNEHMMFRVKLF